MQVAGGVGKDAVVATITEKLEDGTQSASLQNLDVAGSFALGPLAGGAYGEDAAPVLRGLTVAGTPAYTSRRATFSTSGRRLGILVDIVLSAITDVEGTIEVTFAAPEELYPDTNYARIFGDVIHEQLNNVDTVTQAIRCAIAPSEGSTLWSILLYRMVDNGALVPITHADLEATTHLQLRLDVPATIPHAVASFTVPAFYLDGIIKVLADLIATVTRPSAKWVIDADGAMTQVSASAAAYAWLYDSVLASFIPAGILFERESTNLFTYSEDLTEASVWTPNSATFSANAAEAADGTMTLDKIVEGTGTIHTGLTRNMSVVSGTRYSMSFEVKAIERDWIVASFNSSHFSNASAYFNADTGEFGTINAGMQVSSRRLGNGNHRITFTATATATGTVAIALRMRTSDGGGAYTGDGASGMAVGKFQWETGDPTSYIPATGASTATRSADVAESAAATLYETAGTYSAKIEAYVPAVLPLSGEYFVLHQIGDDPDNNVRLDVDDAGVVQLRVTTAGVEEVALGTEVVTADSLAIITFDAAQDAYSLAVNGAAAETSSSGDMPAGLDTVLWCRSDSGEHWNAPVRLFHAF